MYYSNHKNIETSSCRESILTHIIFVSEASVDEKILFQSWKIEESLLSLHETQSS